MFTPRVDFSSSGNGSKAFKKQRRLAIVFQDGCVQAWGQVLDRPYMPKAKGSSAEGNNAK